MNAEREGVTVIQKVVAHLPCSVNNLLTTLIKADPIKCSKSYKCIFARRESQKGTWEKEGIYLVRGRRE